MNHSYYYFATVENGVGYSKSFGDDKPITFFASAGDKWWKFWEWSIGVDVNINGYGGGFSIGPEASVSIHAGNSSHGIGLDALGRLSHKMAYNNGDGYVYSKYSINIPETAFAVVGIPTALCSASALIPLIETFAFTSGILGATG